MHAESGQKALADCRLTDEFWKIAHPEADAMKIVDKHGRVTFEDDEPPQGEHGTRSTDRALSAEIDQK
jgi:hypothetical protein